MFVSIVRRHLFVLVLLGAAGCSSATEPGELKTTHPSGAVTDTLPSASAAHALAISRSGKVVVGELFASDVLTAPIASFTFGPHIPVGALPVDLAVTRDGNTAFVAGINAPTVQIVDLAADSVEGVIDVRDPLRVLLSPNDRRLYIASSNLLINDSKPSTVYAVDVASRTIIDSVIVGSVANGIAYDDLRGRLYVATQGDATINEIDPQTLRIVRQLYVGGTPQDIAVSPDHSELWLADEAMGVRVFDLASGTELGTIPGTSQAFGLAISPDGAQVYVTETMLHTVVVIDRVSRTVVSSFSTGARPERVAFNSTGTNVVITDELTGAILIR